ncbi:MAG: tryptophan--tRNA ligase [Candidatus Moraniibacteriota bacterium]
MHTKRIFSGIQPSGNLHLGNYLGAIRQWVDLQNDYEAIFCIVDLHAITVPQDPIELRRKTLEIAKIYLASGIDPKKSTLFIQSHLSGHTQLAWILNTITKNGDLTKMTQFKMKTGFDEEAFEIAMKEKAEEKFSEWLAERGMKITDKADKEELADAIRKITLQVTVDTYRKFLKEPFNSATVGLFDYPVLMAADILLYDTDVVPVGKDQLQHIELARTLARRFNERFGETFVIPEGKLSKEGALIMGLDDPTKKMSKSASSEYNYIALSDTPEQVRRKIMKAVTDSGSEIAYSDDPRELDGASAHGASKPALKNLINIYSLLSGETPPEIVAKFAGKGYGDFKKDLAEVIIAFLVPLQERMAKLTDEEVLKILAEGKERIRPLAVKKMKEVFEKVGLISY